MEKIDTGTDQLLVEKENGVATIILNRPEVRNALSTQLTPALRRMIAQMGEDREVGALLITGAESAFCSGGDIKGMGKGEPQSQSTKDRVEDLRLRQKTLTGALVALRKPTIAALPGAAAGAAAAIGVTPHFSSSCFESSAASATVKLDKSSIILFRSGIFITLWVLFQNFLRVNYSFFLIVQVKY